jgi:hypothetical protein
MRRRALLVALAAALVLGLTALAAPGAGARGNASLLSATLSGASEVPGPGDPDGRGRALVKLAGDRACFLLRWSGIQAPVAAHIHVGGRGVAGDVVVPFFEPVPGAASLPATLHAVAGCVDVAPELADAIADHPGRYYVNVHTADFPGGAVRGQLRRGGDLDLGLPDQLTARLRGANEVPPADRDGRGQAFVRAGEDRVCFAVGWTRIAPPIFAHIHRGVAGVNGPVVVLLFDVPELAPGGAPVTLPATVTAAAGCIAGQDPAVLRDIRRHPSAYYVNVHNVPYPGGAIRGQLRRA